MKTNMMDYPQFNDQTVKELAEILLQYVPSEWQSLHFCCKNEAEGMTLNASVRMGNGDIAEQQYVEFEPDDAAALAEIMERAMPFGDENCAETVDVTITSDGSYKVTFS